MTRLYAIAATVLVVFICALSVYSIAKSPDLLSRGNPYTGLGYLIAGVAGVFGSMIIGLPLIFGGL